LSLGISAGSRTIEKSDEEVVEIHIPLNSNNSRESALILALIMCGVAAVRPAATMVMYSSALAWTVSGSQRGSERARKDETSDKERRTNGSAD